MSKECEPRKTTNKNPRSTVGTITEIYDFMRLLYARASDAYSYNTGKKMVKWSEEEIVENIFIRFSNAKISLLAPIVRSRKGHYRELFEELRKNTSNNCGPTTNGSIRQLNKTVELYDRAMLQIPVYGDIVVDFQYNTMMAFRKLCKNNNMTAATKITANSKSCNTAFTDSKVGADVSVATVK